MKIFNWVHRRFQHKDGFDRNVKKAAEFVTNDADTQVLLEQIGLVDKLGGWRDGILTIGTLGFDPKTEYPTWEFKEEQEEEEEFDIYEQELMDDQEVDDDDDDDEEEEEDDDTENDEINPLVHPTIFKHGFDDDVVSKGDVIMTIDGISLSPNKPPNELVVDFDNSTNLKYEKMEKIRGERITLADLFSADSEAYNKKKQPPADDDHHKVHPNSFKKSNNIHIHTKNGISFAKKLLPRNAEDSRPIQKMQRLVTKMLKRKIHPDLEGKIPKKDSSVGLRTNKCGAISESISLLQTQDVVV